MNEKRIQLDIGQRVRIIEEEDSSLHIGKMATVEEVKLTVEREPICYVRIDRSKELISLPQRYLKPITTIPSSLLVNNLSLPWDPEPKERLRRFTDNNWLAAHILETLLFYNQIIVPTTDYSTIVPLVHWLGAPLLSEMLAAHAISFVHTSGMLAYIGNGVGLSIIEIIPGKEGKNQNRGG